MIRRRVNLLLQDVPMRQPTNARTALQALALPLRDPSGLVCAALLLALFAVVVQIASVW